MLLPFGRRQQHAPKKAKPCFSFDPHHAHFGIYVFAFMVAGDWHGEGMMACTVRKYVCELTVIALPIPSCHCARYSVIARLPALTTLAADVATTLATMLAIVMATVTVTTSGWDSDKAAGCTPFFKAILLRPSR